MQSSAGSAHHQRPKNDDRQSRQLARAKWRPLRRQLPHAPPDSHNARRSTPPLSGLGQHRAVQHQNRYTLSQKPYLKRQKIRRAFRTHWSTICVGSATHVSSCTAPLFIWMRHSITRRCYPGCRGSACPRSVASFNILRRIERRYRLQEGYFKE